MDYAIVTIRIERLDWQVDLELPANLPLKELSGKILETLKLYREDLFEEVSALRLFYMDRELDREGSLAAYGIWDGSILEVRTEL